MVLPMRGALAATAHCAGGSGGLGSALAVADSQEAHSHAAHSHEAHPHHGHGHGLEGHLSQGDRDLLDVSDMRGSAADPVDTCNYCSASCSVTPILSVMAPSAPSILLPRASLPALVAPPPSHLSEGQDRPPQSA